MLAVDLLAGAVGGCASVFVSQPLDTVKVKMQLYPHVYKSMYSCLTQVIRKNGVRGIYAGTTPALMSNCAENAVMFGTYGQCQKIVASITNAGVETKNLNYLQNAAAGGIASIFTSVVICPTELIKVRMQTDYGDVKTRLSAGGVIKNIWNAGGFRGFYRGLTFTVAREMIGCSLFFGAYEWTREILKPKDEPKEQCDALSTMAAGAIAGIVNWVAVYPLDVIKSQIQSTKDDSVRKLIKQQIAGKGGVRALYSGLWPTLMKTIPATAVLLFAIVHSGFRQRGFFVL
ncbi:mitochondrial ornithine transporter 1-like [Adelges cooleyi]|uniref:mitochondrial ornithine transporter 1-like n=1 Tax=Adelges cooleyi TaxID=133065 RepID=UPI002180873D|nr:mitochondrial ornithine transporter 1-like [Adelges cooleyi]